jgi:hypothetical protein
MAGIELTLMSRGYCHLCHDMEVALAPLAAEFGATVTVLDVDADPDLEANTTNWCRSCCTATQSFAITFWTKPKPVNIWPKSARIQGLLKREGRQTAPFFTGSNGSH